VLPYGFVPIDLHRIVVDSPVWHDGSSGGELLSGEILCELEALTPLLPGSARYPVRKDGKDDGALFIKDAIRDILKKLGGQNPKAGKQVAEPLRMLDGRVVIAGTALKGMLRHSLGALASAPMERASEHHYTYRPNLDFNGFSVKERCVVRPALVTNANNGGWDIEVFADARAALFVRKEAEKVVQAACSNGVVAGLVTGVERQGSHLILSKGSVSLPAPHRLATYRGGIDGQGILAAAFKQNKDKEDLKGRYLCERKNPKNCRGPFTYDLALVPKKFACTLEIKADLYQRYLKDQKAVLADNKFGHLTAHPLDVDVDQVVMSVKKYCEFTAGQLIYVELTTDAKGEVTKSSEVVSCGHHFRYRWAYTSSVRNKNGIRACLAPVAEERMPSGTDHEKDMAPGKLTGARLLFGYVRDDETNPIGKGVFERLAGRIAINHAVSDGVPEFLGDPDTGYCIPLRILGQPKPSAWEFYLQQPKDKTKPLATYGDLPDDAGGELAGRKFYRHQKRITEKDIRAATPDEINSDQATLARFICKPGTKFRFTIRFARLRDWELGALLAVLEPHLLADGGDRKDYAHKLGLGRPLGMGSVRILRKDIRIRAEKKVDFLGVAENVNCIEQALTAIRGKVKQNVDVWLGVHKLVDGRRLAYPLADTKVDGQPVKTIYAWHTNLRRKYSKLRRQKSADWSQLHNDIDLINNERPPR
jgi:CRISPR-associated protein (TIGR03986 family)